MKEKCKSVIIEAGKKLLEVKSLKIEEKTDFRNLVTQYDTMTQDFLVSNFKEIAPQATYLCEEGDEKHISECMFIIDPIDGTANFVKDMNMSCISVAYVENAALKWGLVYNPFVDELFEAEAGKGAMLNGSPIHVSDQPLKNNLVIVGTSPYNQEYKEETLRLTSEVLSAAMDVRRTGSAALDMCSAASGRCGLYFEKVVQAWDVAAGILIAKEAGAEIMNFDMEAPDFTKPGNIICGSPQCVDEFVEILKNMK